MKKMFKNALVISFMFLLVGCKAATRLEGEKTPEVPATTIVKNDTKMAVGTPWPYFFRPTEIITVDFGGSVKEMDYQLVERLATGEEKVVVNSFYKEMCPKGAWLEAPGVLSVPEGASLVLWNAHTFESDSTGIGSAYIYDVKTKVNSPIKSYFPQQMDANQEDFSVSPDGKNLAYLNCPVIGETNVCSEIRVIDLVIPKEIKRVTAAANKSFAQSYERMGGGFKAKMEWSSDSASLTVGEYPMSSVESWSFEAKDGASLKIEIGK